MSKTYPVGIVGESNYQPAIRQCHVGEVAYIRYETDNPYDDLALRVDSITGHTIGYIPKSSFVRDVVHEQGRGVAATIMEIASAADTKILGVVLSVAITDDDIFEVSHKAPPAATAPQKKPSSRSGFVAGILRALNK